MKKKDSVKIYLLSFLVPMMIMILFMMLKKILPFGDMTFLRYDSASQYITFLTELSDKLNSGKGIFYSFRTGMGKDFFVEGTYYFFSPFNIMVVFFKGENVALFFSLLVILKLSLAGLNMSIYLNKHYLDAKNISIVVISCSYALCSYSLNYYYHIMWMDGFMLFPLLVLFIEYLVEGKKAWKYTALLSYCLISNFYIGYMICISSVIYFAYLLFVKFSRKDKNIFKIICTYVVHSFLAGMIASVALIPAFIGLTQTGSGSSYISDKVDMIYYPWYINIFRMIYKSYPTYWHYPYLYTTLAVFVLVPLYFVSKYSSKKEKIGRAIILLIMIASFEFSKLDFAWNGFHYVNGFAGRQSFVYIFIVLVMCYEALNYTEKIGKETTICFAIAVMGLALSVRYLNLTKVYFEVVTSVVAIVGYFVLVNVKLNWEIKKKIFCICIFIEILMNVNLIDVGYGKKEYYSQIIDYSEVAEVINDDGFYRMKNANTKINNEANISGYYSISTYSSMANGKVQDVLCKLGMVKEQNAYPNAYYNSVIFTLFDVKYMITEFKGEKFDNWTLVGKTKSGDYIYKNDYDMSIGFLIPTGAMDSAFDDYKGDDEFELINRIIYNISKVSDVYTNNGNGVVLNHNKYCEAMDIVEKNKIHLEKINNECDFFGNINAAYDGEVFTSIPYSKGFSVYVDGKKVKTKKSAQAFLSFDIQSGKHNIEFKYETEGFKTGLTISIVGVLLLVILTIICRKINRNQQNKL